MRILQYGADTRLYNQLTFSLLPGVTCVRICDGCYAMKGPSTFKHTKTAWRRNTDMAMNNPWEFVKSICSSLLNRRIRVVRIHQAGDIFDKEYCLALYRLAEAFPEFKFYGFTKQLDNLLPDPPSNMIIHKSLLPDGEPNFGHPVYLKDIRRKYWSYKLKTCPKTIKGSDQRCGIECSVCWNEKYKNHYILFNQH